MVTGASGFVGRALCKTLSGQGHDVIGLTRSGSGVPFGTALQCDLAAPFDVSRLPDGCDAIVHLAQSSHFREFPDGARDMFEVNIRVTFELLEFARQLGVKRFVYASSGGIYGQGTEAFSDRHPLVMANSLGFYLSTKLVGELLVENYDTFFKTATLRIFFAYGPTQQSDRLIPRLLNNVLQGRPIMLQGETGLSINPIYIDDVVEIMIRAIETDEILKLNVAGEEILTLREIAETIGKVVGRAPKFDVRPAAQSPRLVGDTSRLLGKLRHKPKICFSEGVRRLFEHAVRG